MDLKEVMAKNLRRARHDRKLTQEELAELAGLSARYLGAVERGDVSASVTVLGRIADALGRRIGARSHLLNDRVAVALLFGQRHEDVEGCRW